MGASTLILLISYMLHVTLIDLVSDDDEFVVGGEHEEEEEGHDSVP